ncbi:MAG: hypothetical protein PHY62_08530 [Gallionella sp.]|nr:hypothetical protein [Gallionella sp.]
MGAPLQRSDPSAVRGELARLSHMKQARQSAQRMLGNEYLD